MSINHRPPAFEKAPASGLPAISANFRGIIKQSWVVVEGGVSQLKGSLSAGFT